MESHTILGGNIRSVVIGEFSYSWSLALLALYVGIVVRDAQIRWVNGPWPGIVLALLALSHVLSVAIGVAVAASLLLQKTRRGAIVVSWILGFGLVAFWAVPFVALVLGGMSPDSNWQTSTELLGPNSPIPRDLMPALPLAIVGLIWSLKLGDRAAPFVGLAVIPLSLYFLLPTMNATAVTNVRLLPYWYFAAFVLAGIGVGRCVVALGSRVRGRSDGVPLVGLGVAAAVVIITLVSVQSIPAWVQFAYSGYEGKPDYGEYESLMSTVDRLPPGRIAWEFNPGIGVYGTPLALTLFPYWSPEHPSMQGLYYESSLTTPFNFLNESEISRDPSLRVSGLRYHPLDFVRAVAHLQLYDVAYYVSFTPEAEAAARSFGLEQVGTAPPWTVFSLPESEGVQVATSQPAVWAGSSPFSAAALEWYDDIDHLDRWMVASGDTEWTRITSVDERLAVEPTLYDTGDSAVTNIVIEDDRITFDTTAVGVPHLVKVSYFPNWVADGADGPFRAAPSLMVVVPTQQSVTLSFGRTRAEAIGLVVTAASLAAVGLWLYRLRKPDGPS